MALKLRQTQIIKTLLDAPIIRCNPFKSAKYKLSQPIPPAPWPTATTSTATSPATSAPMEASESSDAAMRHACSETSAAQNLTPVCRG